MALIRILSEWHEIISVDTRGLNPAKSILIINENNSKLDFQGDQDNLSDI